MSYNIGPKIGIDGEKEFRNSIRKINTEYKTLEAETSAVTKAFDAQGNEQGKLEATVKQLHKQIEKQKEKMTLLEGAVAKASEKFGENSEEAIRLRGVLYDTQATVSKLEKELDDTSSRLEKAEDAMEEFEESTEDAGDAAIDFGDLLKANVISDVIMSGLRKFGDLTKDFIAGSIESAAEVKAETAQFEQTFSAIEEAARASLQSISDDTNIASTRMQSSFTKIYAFAKTAGAESGEALTIASRAMVAAADNAAYYDKSIEDATEQLQSFLKGNYANDAALGITATETARNTMANKLYAESFNKLSESQKVDVLLAMVEAGNKASGAIGQAARESDSWENVTGELAEVMRLLQAEAGKPALKKLIPIIQKITKSGYELIEDIDWDAFGEKIEGIADYMIDVAPGIIKAIASITAGIVAMKVTQKVGQFVDLSRSFLQVASAAKTAGAAVAASGAVMNATPWGLIATAIGLVVAGLVSLCLSSDNVCSEARELDEAMERFNSSLDKAEEKFHKTTREIDIAASSAEQYAKRLLELEAAGLDNTVAQEEYRLLVEKINVLIPELNLAIDEQTGLLDSNSHALLGNIEAWKQKAHTAALEEKFKKVIEAEAQAQASLVTAQAKLNIKQTETLALEEQKKAKLEEYNAAFKKCEELKAIAYTASGDAFDVAHAQACAAEQDVFRLKQEYSSICNQLALNKVEQGEINAEIEEANALVASYADDINLAWESLKLLNKETTDCAGNQKLLSEAAQKVKNSLYDLAIKYDEAKNSAKESIDTQVGLFETLETKSEWSKSKILESWKSQQEAFSSYSANLQKAVKMGLDEKLIEQLSDGSAESMQILQAMMSGTQSDIERFNAEFAKTETARNALAETMAGIHTDVTTELDAIVQDAQEAGCNIVAGATEAIRANSGDFLDSIVEMATQGIDWFEETFDINSPSRVMWGESADIVAGSADGVDENAELFEKSMEDLATSGYDAFFQERLDRAEQYPDIVSNPSVSSRTTHTNYGGVTFQIYQQPGESVEDLYYRFMDMMQQELMAKEAAL